MKKSQEEQFIDRIDCNIPYRENEQYLSLIDEAASISANAIFKVIEELCRIPASDKQNVSSQYLIALLKLTGEIFEHPLKEMILDASEKMIFEEELSVDEVILKMAFVRHFPGQFSALSILYFSCNDKEAKLEPIWDSILAEWKKNGA